MSIHTATRDGVMSIEIARPEKMNALTSAMYRTMAESLRAAAADPAVRTVVIAGQPGIFTAGNDLGDFLERPPEAPDAPVSQFMHTLVDLDKPVIAAVTGRAVGIGVTLLLHCDLVYLAEGAELSMPFVALGLVPEFASSLLLPQLIGHARAAERFFLGEPLDAAAALACGLANAVIPAARVLDHAMRVAARLGALPPGAVQESKRLLKAAQRAAIHRAIESESAVFAARLRSAEAQDAFRAFLARSKSGPSTR